MRSRYRSLIAALLVFTMIIAGGCGRSTEGDTEADDNAAKASETVKPQETGDTIYVMTDNTGKTTEVYKGSEIADTNETRLPLELEITYFLDGAEVQADEITGRSGKVTMRLDYSVLEYEKLKIQGDLCTIYTPVLVISAAVLDNSKFSNVSVSSGKVIGAGGNTAVLGYALPGLSDSLGISSSDGIDIPGYVEINAYSESFELPDIYTVVSTDILEDYDSSDPDMLTDLISDVSSMNKAMSELINGAKSLESGLASLMEGAEKISEATDSLVAGAAETTHGAGSVSKAAGELYSGLSEISANSNSLNTGAKEVFENLLVSAETQLKANGLMSDEIILTIENYEDTLGNIVDSLDEDRVYETVQAEVTAAVEAERPEIEKQVTAAVRSQVWANVEAAAEDTVAEEVTAAVRAQVTASVIYKVTGRTVEAYEQGVSAGLFTEQAQTTIGNAVEQQMASAEIQIENTVNEKMASEDVQTQIASETERQMASDEVKNLIAQNVEAEIQQLISDNMASDEVEAELAKAAAGAQAVIALKSSLDSYNSFYLGVLAYTESADLATGGAGKLKDGAEALAEGTQALSDGSEELNENMVSFSEGIEKLSEGSSDLYAGMIEFDNNAIKKLSDFVNKDLSGYNEKIKAISDTGRKYISGHPLSNGSDGRYHYVFKSSGQAN